jgi:hypothetical protein
VAQMAFAEDYDVNAFPSGSNRSTEFDSGRVKTCAHEKRAELSSLLSRPGNRRQRVNRRPILTALRGGF